MKFHPTHEIDSEIHRIFFKLRKYSDTLQGDCTKDMYIHVSKHLQGSTTYGFRGRSRIPHKRGCQPPGGGTNL